MTIGIIGLGVMGTAVAGHLLEAGFTVRGFDTDPKQVGALRNLGGVPEPSSAAVAAESDIVLLWLPSVAALDEVTEEIADSAHDGLLVIEMGTLPLSAKTASRDKLAVVGVDLMDAPVSGTGHQAADATLVIFASGSAAGFEKAKPIFDVIGKASYHFPEFGHGSVMKYIANLLVTIHNLAAAEAHVLGMAAGLDPALVQQVMSDGVGASRMFDIRGPMMVADRYEPPAGRLDIVLKDAGIIKEYAESRGAPTPLLNTALPIYLEASQHGLGEEDAAAICRYLERLGNIRRRHD
jgi:putative dehydrogenase